MSRVFTVTVISQNDPHDPGDAALRQALRHQQWGSEVVARDDVYFLELPDSVTDEVVASFGRDFLAGDPSRIAHCVPGVALPELPAAQVGVIIGRRTGVMDPVEGSVLHALGDNGIAAENARRTRECKRTHGSTLRSAPATIP